MSFGTWRLTALASAALLGGLILTAPPAQAWWRGGVWIGVPPVVVAPPIYPPYYYPPAYYPPYAPAYYPPAPGYAQAPGYSQPGYAQQGAPAQATPVPPSGYADNSGAPAAYGATCYAGVYVCPAPGNTQIGANCSCAGLGAPSYGTVH